MRVKFGKRPLDPTPSPKHFFKLKFQGEIVLNDNDLWPDGDAPAKPSVRDVVEFLSKEFCSPLHFLYQMEIGTDAEDPFVLDIEKIEKNEQEGYAKVVVLDGKKGE